MREIALFLIKTYKKITGFSFGKCCYIPSCSDYACAAFEKYAWGKAARLTILRILRCHPLLAKGGYDPLK